MDLFINNRDSMGYTRPSNASYEELKSDVKTFITSKNNEPFFLTDLKRHFNVDTTDSDKKTDKRIILNRISRIVQELKKEAYIIKFGKFGAEVQYIANNG